MTLGWAAYIRRQLDERDRAMTKAVAQAIVAEEKARATADDALRQEMRTTIDKLTERLDRLGGRQGRAAACRRLTMCDQNRPEDPPRPLRVLGSSRGLGRLASR
jgi:hypothetical protein